jgi:hypothetical protein
MYCVGPISATPRDEALGRGGVIRKSDRANQQTIAYLELTKSVAQEPEGSSPHSQQPTTGPCPKPDKPNPHPPSQSP